MAKVAIVIQARLKSTRLPGKTMLMLPSGYSVIQEVVNRCADIGCSSVKMEDIQIVVAIPDTPDCDILSEHITNSDLNSGFIVYRGSEDDVLSRFAGAVLYVTEVDHVMRITADCPCLDPHVCSLILERHIAEDADYTSNTINRTYPHGYDCEVFRADLLMIANNSAMVEYDREHVTPYIKRRAEKTVSVEQEYYEGMTRLTLDTIEDYVHICKFLG